MNTHEKDDIKQKEITYKNGKLILEQQKEFKRLIDEYEDIFVRDKNELGRTNIVKHSINTGNEKPIKQRSYRMSQKEKEINKEELQKMLKKGVIQKSRSPWSSPVTFVSKKNGEVRYCIDYRKLNRITKKDNHPLPRIDDMLDQFQGHSRTFEQYLKDLEEVFERIRKAGLKLRMDKCHCCDREIEFLGYVVGKDGIKTSEKIIEKVKNYPRPTNITEARGFIGLASYYRRFIQNFSEMTRPITELFQKGVKYEWNKIREENFQKLKEKLTTTPVLAYPNFEKEFILYTDASGYALGAVLSQEDTNGKEHVIQYAARSLSKAEQVYSTTEQECLAVVWAINKFHHYIYGKKCRVVTDRSSLR